MTAVREAKPGDTVVQFGRKVGASGRSGGILEVLGDNGNVHFRVRWSDGHESVFFPSSDVTIEPAGSRS